MAATAHGIEPPSTGPAAASPEDVLALARRVPALVVGSKSCPPFIARGAMPNVGYAYEIVSDGTRCRIAIFDVDDGLPLMVGTDQGTVVLDLVAGKLWSVNGVRLNLTIEPRSGSAGTLTSVTIEMDGRAEIPTATQFTLRPAVFFAKDASTIESRPDGRTRLTQRVDDDYRRIMDFAPPPSRNLSFGQTNVATGKPTSYHEWTLDDVKVSPAELTLPAMGKLPFNNALVDNVDHARLPFPSSLSAPPSRQNMLAALQAYSDAIDRFQMFATRGGMIRRAMRGDAASRAKIQELGVDLAKVAIHDRELREPWLAGLRTLGVTLRPPTTPWAGPPHIWVAADTVTTQPATRP